MLRGTRPTWARPALLLALVLLLAACGAQDDSAAEGGTDTATEDGDTGSATPEDGDGSAGGELRVGMALPGPQNDKGFSQAHYEGLLLVEEEFGAEVSVRENVLDPQARVEALRDLAQDNELVIGVGAEYAEAGTVVAPQFPDVTFMVINGELSEDAPNLHVYGFREGVPAYIAGVVAAELTEAGQAGFVGGEEIPPLFQAQTGFTAGLQSVDSAASVSETIVGSFVDPQGAYAAAESQLAAGADVIYGYVDSGIVGVIEAIVDAGDDALAFGIIFPRCDEFPQIVGTSIVNASGGVLSMVEDYVEGDIPTALYRGVEDPELQRFELCPEHDTPELRQLVDDTTEAINSGEIELPADV